MLRTNFRLRSVLEKIASLRDHKSSAIENRAQKVVLRTLLGVTTAVIGLLFVLLVLSYAVAENEYILPRVVAGGFALLYVIATQILHRRHYYHHASLLLVILYVVTAILAIWEWGINVPFALLMMSIAVTLAGILLGARYALWAAAVFSVYILGIELLNSMALYSPNVSWQVGAQPKLGEALGYCLLLSVLAVVSWLFGRQIEQSLSQARTAEAALSREKRMLAVRLEERTEELRAVQLQEMQQLYRFAELGQLSTALIHDVANHLSILTLDIEDLKKQTRSETIEKAVESARQSISYLDDLVKDVRVQLHNEEHPRYFDVAHNIQTVAQHLEARFKKEKIKLRIEVSGDKKYMSCYGDATRFSQIMTILIKNGLDAATETSSSRESDSVSVNIHANSQAVVVTISDWGIGVTAAYKDKIFQPFFGTKKSGMGIGLFITRTIIETHFKGDIQLANSRKPTMFKIVIPNRKAN